MTLSKSRLPFNDMTYAGLVKAKNTYGFTLYRQVCAGTSIEFQKKALDALIASGARIVVCNGWEFKQIVEEYAGKFPDHTFVINDIPVRGYANVMSTVFGQHEGSFLAGALAAWVSKTGKIGFIRQASAPFFRVDYSATPA